MTATPSRAARRRPGLAGLPGLPRPAARAVVVGTALTLALAGCQGSDGEPEPSETPLGAVDRLFEQMSEQYDEEAYREKEMQVQELVAECMSAEGFEYFPVAPGDAVLYARKTLVAPEGGEDEIPWGTLEFAEQWGYGITVQPEMEDPGLSPEPVPVDPGMGEDPNSEYVAGMSESEQTAYYTALHGTAWNEPIDPEGGDEWVPPTWEEMGCFGAAQHEVYGDAAFGGGEEFQGLMDELNLMWEAIAEDDRVNEANAEWASCMADEGQTDVAKVGDGEQLINDLVMPIWDEVYGELPPDATDEDWLAAEDEIRRRVAEYTDQEVELAVADYTCREDVGYDDLLVEINLDHQQRFYDEHKAELERWVESQGGGAVG